MISHYRDIAKIQTAKLGEGLQEEGRRRRTGRLDLPDLP